MKSNKKIKILTTHLLKYPKGIVTNQVIRFIATGADPLLIFLKAYSKRNGDDLKSDFFQQYHFVVYDKNQSHLEFFKRFLDWSGHIFADEQNTVGLQDFLMGLQKELNVEIEDFDYKELKELLYVSGFTNKDRFLECWSHFQNCQKEFIKIDIFEENEKFVDFLRNLPTIDIGKVQFINLGVNASDLSSDRYQYCLNEICHLMYMFGVKKYKSMALIADKENNFVEEYVGKIYVEMNPSFCILPHMHIQYKPSGQAKLCCRYDTVKEHKDHDENIRVKKYSHDLSELFLERNRFHNIQISSIEESFFSNYWNEARQLTASNESISGCHKCYKEELGNNQAPMSMRLGSNILYNHGYLHKNIKFRTPRLEFLELGFGNYCNLACLSCNSSLSTTWHNDEIKLNEVADEKTKRTIFPKLENLTFQPDKTSLSTLKVIKFTGGEPMINPEFVKFIDYICEEGRPEQIELEIYTNCSYIPSEKLIANLSRFKEIHLNLSIDAYGQTNDYLRYGSKWETSNKQSVLKSLDFWLDRSLAHKNIKLIMSTTLSVLNVYDLPKLVEWWLDYYYKSGNDMFFESTNSMIESHKGFFKIQVAFDPDYIAVDILPKNFYDELATWMEAYKEKFLIKYPDLPQIPDCVIISFRKLESLINRCKGNKNKVEQLLHYLKSMDQIRGNNFKDSLPTLSQKMNNFLNN
jgi:organic radical activating enzyme